MGNNEINLETNTEIITLENNNIPIKMLWIDDSADNMSEVAEGIISRWDQRAQNKEENNIPKFEHVWWKCGDNYLSTHHKNETLSEEAAKVVRKNSNLPDIIEPNPDALEPIINKLQEYDIFAIDLALRDGDIDKMQEKNVDTIEELLSMILHREIFLKTQKACILYTVYAGDGKHTLAWKAAYKKHYAGDATVDIDNIASKEVYDRGIFSKDGNIIRMDRAIEKIVALV